MFVSRECERSCRCGLPRAEVRKVAAARGEGRSAVVATELSSEATIRPSGQHAAAPFRRRDAARQVGSVLWFAPVGALSAESVSRTEASQIGLAQNQNHEASRLSGKLCYVGERAK